MNKEVIRAEVPEVGRAFNPGVRSVCCGARAMDRGMPREATGYVL